MGSVPCFTAQRNQSPLHSEPRNDPQTRTLELGKLLRRQPVAVSTGALRAQVSGQCRGGRRLCRRGAHRQAYVSSWRTGTVSTPSSSAQLCSLLPPWCQGKGHTHPGIS